MLFIRLHDIDLGCHVGPIFAESFGYTDVAMDTMISL